MMKLFVLFFLLCPCAIDSVEPRKDHSLDSSNLCTNIVSKEITRAVPQTQRVKEFYDTWCLSLPPRCKDYRWKTVTIYKTVKINQTRIKHFCCEGYHKEDNTCVPYCKDGCGNGKCVEPDVCFCEPGWRGSDCSMECEPNRYGSGCLDICTCLNGGICDRKDGSCSCVAGFIGEYCENTCPDDMYGDSCLGNCTCENEAMCDQRDGTCYCTAGYYGENCESICQPGSHGENCLLECACIAETTETCHHVDGHCICKPGYTGDSCEKECDNFTYGPDCENECDCINAEFCDPYGRCICKSGWTGEKCDETCALGTFGEECLLKCAKCPNESSTCNHVNGHCDCAPGNFGVMCENECLKGYWGTGCLNECECSDTEICDAVTGNCTCPPGFKATNCSEPCDPGWYGYNCSFICKCSDTKLCDAETGSCFSSGTAESLNFSNGRALVGPLTAVAVIIALLLAIVWAAWKFPDSISSLRSTFTTQNLNCSSGGTSTDYIIDENYINPLYGNEVNNNPVPTAEGPTPPQASQADTEFHTVNLDAGEVGAKALEKEMSENCYETMSEIDNKNFHFVPESLGDFKIPEDEIYEVPVSLLRKVECLEKDVEQQE